MAQIKLMNSMGEVVKDVERKFIKAGIGTVNNLAAVSRANAQREVRPKTTLQTKRYFFLFALRFMPSGECTDSHGAQSLA